MLKCRLCVNRPKNKLAKKNNGDSSCIESNLGGNHMGFGSCQVRGLSN